jgi:hypothetical protein
MTQSANELEFPSHVFCNCGTRLDSLNVLDGNTRAVKTAGEDRAKFTSSNLSSKRQLRMLNGPVHAFELHQAEGSLGKKRRRGRKKKKKVVPLFEQKNFFSFADLRLTRLICTIA